MDGHAESHWVGEMSVCVTDGCCDIYGRAPVRKSAGLQIRATSLRSFSVDMEVSLLSFRCFRIICDFCLAITWSAAKDTAQGADVRWAWLTMTEIN